MHPLRCLIFLSALLLLAGCSSRQDLVVLTPDPDGKVGEVTVTTRGGSRTLTEANTAVTVGDADRIPEAPEAVEKETIEVTFGKALGARPDPPAYFILYFHSGTTDLTDESLRKLPEVLQTARSRGPCDIGIVGHTDTQGSKAMNMRLSLARANAVRDQLIAIGVDPSLMKVTSHGEANPLVPTGDNVNEPRNRRVEVEVR